MERTLFTTADEHNGGHVIGYIIGLLYMFGFIYYIYKKFLNVIFEDLLSLLDIKLQDNDNEDTYRPILYSFLHSLQYLILCFFTTFSSKSDLGVAAIVGSDAFIILLLFGLILIKYPQSNHGTLDAWTTTRDSVIYFCGLLVMLICLISNWVKIGTSLVLLGYYIINIIVIFNNQEIKEKIMEWLNINNEDNEFSSDQHLEYKKRRFSITQLKDAGFVDAKDINLQKRMNRMEALLVIIYGKDQQEKLRIRARFQGAVLTVMFAIRNHVKNERNKRTEFYLNMYQPKKNQVKSDDEQRQNNHLDQQDADQDEHPLMHKGSESNHVESVNQNQDKDQNSNNGIPQEILEKDEAPNLRVPDGILNKVMWVIFFPVHLILFLLPNYIDNAVPKKLVLCFFLNLCLLCGCYFLIDWWAWELSIATGIPVQIIGIIFLGSFLSIQYVAYNLDVAKVETKLEFAQAFYQTAICKIGFCTGLPWVLRVLVELNIEIETSRLYENAFSIAIAVFAGMILLFLAIGALKRFILTSEDGVKYLVLYSLFILSSTIIIALNILE